MKVVHIYRDDTMDDITISDIQELSDHSKSQGNNDISLLYTWLYESREFQCYGWYDGEPGFENKHELPPGGKSSFLAEDSSTQLLFGDLFICQREVSSPAYIDCDISEYGEFYNMCFEGFHDILTSDEDDISSVTTDDDDLHVDDLHEETEEDELVTDDDEFIQDSHTELDLDTFVYE
jgi:hypothetical protein